MEWKKRDPGNEVGCPVAHWIAICRQPGVVCLLLFFSSFL